MPCFKNTLETSQANKAYGHPPHHAKPHLSQDFWVLETRPSTQFNFSVYKKITPILEFQDEVMDSAP